MSSGARIAFHRMAMNAPWVDMMSCDGRFDLLWRFRYVDIMDSPGHIRRLLTLNQRSDQILRVSWDGKFIWISTARTGIHVFTPDGRLVGNLVSRQTQTPGRDETPATASDSDSQLPPYKVSISRVEQNRFLNRGGKLLPTALWMHPVDVGRCIVSGLSGSATRRWFADVRLHEDADKRFDVNVFHTLTRVADRNLVFEKDTDTKVDFSQGWNGEIRDDNRRLLLIGRRAVAGPTMKTGRYPLAIDIESLDVSVYPLLPKKAIDRIQIYNNRPLSVSTFGLYAHRNDPNGNWSRRLTRDNIQGPLLPWNNAIVIPGRKWRRVDVNAGNTKILNEVDLPSSLQLKRFGISSHFGMIGWFPGGELFQIRIAPRQDVNLDAEFSVIPKLYRERHTKAARSIRTLGGSVGTEWAPSRFMPGDSPFTVYSWRTKVWLGPEWKGNTEDLKPLSDLYNLTDLYLVGDAHADTSMRHVVQIGLLEGLRLVDTQITNDGLAHLRGLPRLSYLQLYGPAGRLHFTDEALHHLATLRLDVLLLVGKGFSDDSVTTLSQIPTLRRVQHMNTLISRAGQNRLGIMWSTTTQYPQAVDGR